MAGEQASVPESGIPFRHAADAAQPPAGTLEGGTVDVLERLGAWARVRTQDGREVWVDARRLTTLQGAAAPAADSAASSEPAPPPPPAPTPARPPWLIPAIAAAAVGVVIVLVVTLTGGESETALSTSTTSTPPTTEAPTTSTAAPTTTAPTATTTAPPETTTTTAAPTTTTTSTTTSTTTTSTTTTTTTTTTTIPPLPLTESFDDGTTLGTALFAGVMSWDIAEGIGVLEAVGSGVLPVMYPYVLDNGSVAFDFSAAQLEPTGGIGAVLRSEDPSDGAIEAYVLGYIVPGTDRAVMAIFDNGQFTDVREFPFAPNLLNPTWNRVAVAIVVDTLVITLNGEPVATVGLDGVLAEGSVGIVMLTATPGDWVLIDNVEIN